jgi:GTP-binding protein
MRFYKIMQRPQYNNATFLLSVATLEQLPPDQGAEVAFIGRSNAGKSSALNTITNIKGLARTSKTPGRTQTINLFGLDHHRRFADLPGYGYAKVPLVVKQRWQATLNVYLQTRHCLKGLIIVMDIRHPLKELDKQLIQWSILYNIKLHILLTKSDKLGYGAATNALRDLQENLQQYGGTVSAQLFSSLDRTGLDEARAKLDNWLT